MPAYVELLPGTRITVSPPGDPFGASYEATVRSVLPSQLRLGLPRRDRDVLEVEPGDQLTMFTTVHGRIFRFTASVRLVEVDNDTFFIDTPREAEKTERREFYRLPVRITPRVATRLDDSGKEVQPLHAVILDLGGGGVMLQSREYVAAGSRLRLVFELDGDPFDMDIATLVLTCTRPASNAQHYRLHCQFLEPNRFELERLVRFVYRQQAELRRKGVI
ncbi:MAG: flagellar brake protein [Dehalococcoidia bacterium]